MGPTPLFALALLSVDLPLAYSHGAIVFPPSRNAVEGQLDPWAKGVPYPVIFNSTPSSDHPTPNYPQWCPIADPKANDHTVPYDGVGLSGTNGQACYWFSNGCSIGCDTCDGVTRGPMPGLGTPTPGDPLPFSECWYSNGIVNGSAATPAADDSSPNRYSDHAHDSPNCKTGQCAGMTPGGSDPCKGNCRRKMNQCNSNKFATKPALCHPDLRTYNVNASCGGPTDWYQFAPWRAPGHAPVFDSCGMAGGTPHRGDYGAQYFDTRFARQGDLGSKVLKPRKTGVVWTAGSTVEVSWAIEANHGGGYQYRLCKADDPLGLVEDCFIKHPLPFTNGQRLRWGGKHGRVEAIEGRLASDGPPKVGNYTGRIFTDVKVKPAGSAWARNPIPDDTSRCYNQCREFPPPCKGEIPECEITKFLYGQDATCLCSGAWGPYNMEIVDDVIIPADLTPGEWVLGWRWDAEESHQVWQSCSDVTIVAA